MCIDIKHLMEVTWDEAFIRQMGVDARDVGYPWIWISKHTVHTLGGGPGVVVSTAAFHARVRGSVPGLGGLKETKMFLPHPRVKLSIVGSLRDQEVACSASDLQGSNFESCVWRTVSSHSSHHPQEVILAQLSLYVHRWPKARFISLFWPRWFIKVEINLTKVSIFMRYFVSSHLFYFRYTTDFNFNSYMCFQSGTPSIHRLSKLIIEHF